MRRIEPGTSERSFNQLCSMFIYECSLVLVKCLCLKVVFVSVLLRFGLGRKHELDEQQQQQQSDRCRLHKIEDLEQTTT